jgi:hypothetical protein
MSIRSACRKNVLQRIAAPIASEPLLPKADPVHRAFRNDAPDPAGRILVHRRAGAPVWVRWYCVGVIPTNSVNRCENDPRLLYPTSPHT